VIDHSVQVDNFGTATAFAENTKLEYERNQERYTFLRWGRTPSATSAWCRPKRASCIRWNIEYLARVVFVNEQERGLTPTPWWGPTATPPW